MRRSGTLSALAGLFAVAASASAQQVRSFARGITLTAIKPPSVEALDAVRFHNPERAIRTTDDLWLLEATVDVRQDGTCEIDVEAVDEAGAQLVIRDAGGAAHSLMAHVPLRIFQGSCRANAPQHIVTFFASEAARTVAPASAELLVRVVVGHGDVIRRWSGRLLVRPPDSPR